jgi:glyoxylase-like metal-dependent hydrolase (beta-lactamase superfamily II)
MRFRCRIPSSLIVLGVLCSISVPPAAHAASGVAPEKAAPFRVESLADGVLLFRPPDDRVDLTNALVVTRNDGVLVVNAQPSPGAAREFLAAVERSGIPAPRYLVLLHPHAEAAGGATGFPESTLVIGSDGLRGALEDPEFGFGGEARARALERGVEWTEPPRPAPNLVLFARTLLDDEENPVELLPILHAHTSGDLLVQLPRERIIVAGALLAPDRNPYAADGSVSGWTASLNNIARNRPSLVIPLRGPALDAREVRLVRDAFAWLSGQVELGFIDGLNAARIPERILESPDLPDRFDATVRPNFVRDLIVVAVDEAVESRRKRGIE